MLPTFPGLAMVSFVDWDSTLRYAINGTRDQPDYVSYMFDMFDVCRSHRVNKLVGHDH
jgi:hypothetical protein